MKVWSEPASRPKPGSSLRACWGSGPLLLLLSLLPLLLLLLLLLFPLRRTFSISLTDWHWPVVCLDGNPSLLWKMQGWFMAETASNFFTGRVPPPPVV